MLGRSLDEIQKRGRGYASISDFFNEDHMVDRLYNTKILEGHGGCVNTLKWNKNGELLASGSDDRSIIIWKNGTKQKQIETKHTGNIFAVEFLPSRGDNVVVTGAADSQILMYHVEHGFEHLWMADNRVKRMCTSNYDPFLVWAASEDCVLRQIDTRTRVAETVITKGVSLKTVAISEAKPHMIGIGMERTEVLLYDRRNFSEPFLSLRPSDPTAEHMYVTHLSFSQDGTECVVNQGSGGVMVYDTDIRKEPKYLERIHNILANDAPIEPIVANGLPYKEVRGIGSEMLQAKEYNKLIDYYSGLIHDHYKEDQIRSVLYSNRATAYLCRRKKGDPYASIRDSVKALEEHRGNSKALSRLGRCLILLEQYDLARKVIDVYKRQYPHDGSTVRTLEQALGTEHEDGEETMGTGEGCIDYKERYLGQTNFQTDIKEANFFGSRDQYIVAGSDCGALFIWNRETGKCQGIWKCDEHILNIVQPHPHRFLLATSGIDDSIKFLEPRLERDEKKEVDKLKIVDKYEYINEKLAINREQVEFGIIAQHLLRGRGDCIQS